ncbi:hypothetical protein CB1_001109007, partial [Camelus ferus]
QTPKQFRVLNLSSHSLEDLNKFAPNLATYIQNAENKFSASADEGTIVMSNANNFHMEEAGPDSTPFIGTTSLMKEGNTAKIDATDILEDYTTLLDVPDMEDKNIIIIDTKYLGRFGKTVSNAPEISQKDNSIVIDATNMKDHGRTIVDVQTSSILSANSINDFESIPIPSTYNKANTKSIMTGTDTDEAISNIKPINTTKSFPNYRIYKKINNVISNSNDIKIILDVPKNTMHVGDIIISKTNDITSTKHYANPNSIKPMTNTNTNFKITWPLKEGTIIEGKHTVQMENITTHNNNNIAKTPGSKLNGSVIKYHSNIPANVHLKTVRNYFNFANTDQIENFSPVVQETVNMDQDDGVVEEVIFIHPDTPTTEIRRKGYSLNPDANYIQAAGSKIIPSSYIANMFNPLFKDKTKPFTMDSTNLINNRGDHRTPTTITTNDAKAKTDVERAAVFKTANFQSNIIPIVSVTHPGTVGSVDFSEDSVADMTSDSKVTITLSDKSTDSVDEIINLSHNNKHADDAAGPNPETDFLMYKGYTCLSVAESSTLMPSAQNNQAQNSLLIKGDSLTEVWVSDPVAKNPHVNDTMIQKWKINKVSDPLKIPLESTSLTADFTSPNDQYNATANAGESGFKRNGFVSVDATKSLSQLTSSAPTAEITISDIDLSTAGEENDVLHGVTKPENDKIYFQTLAAKTIANGLGESVAVKQNVEGAEGTEFLPPSSSIPQTGRMDNPILHNLYYNVITDNPLTITKENSNVAQNIIKHKPSLSTVDNADFIDYRDGHQTPAAISASNAKRLTNKGKMAGSQTTNIPLSITPVSGDSSYVNKNTKVTTDLASIAATSPIKRGILAMNEVNTFNNKPNKLGDDLTISREDLNASRDDGTLLMADSSTLKSVAPLNQPQATNLVKEISSADIIIPKTSHKSIPAALTVTTAAQGGADTMFYVPRYESKNSFKEDTTLNYKADPQADIGITAEDKDILKEENVRDHVYVIPTANYNVPKGNSLADKHYSLNSDVYSSTSFKGSTKTTADQLEFENPASTHTTEVSKPLLGKFTSEFQGKVFVRNSNTHFENDEFFDDDILYPMMEENVPKGYNFSPERRSTFTTPNFMIPVKDKINPALGHTVVLGKGISRKKFAFYTNEQTDLGTEKDQIATGSVTNSYTLIIPMTFSTPVSSKNINVENDYHISETGIPLSLGYANTLGDDSFILWPGTTPAKENNLNVMEWIIIEPDKSDSEYTSSKHAFELWKEKNHLIKKPIQFTWGPNGFVSQTPSSKDEASKSLLYRIIHPEFETKDKYQNTILKEENMDSNIVDTSFKDDSKIFNTQHLKTMAPSLTDTAETVPPELLKRSSAEKGTLYEDDDIVILPEDSGLGNKKIKCLFLPHTETIVTMGESRTFGTIPTDHAVTTTSIKSQGHFYKKGISSNVGNTSAPELADTTTSKNSKVNENKMDLAEVEPSEDYINHLAHDIASQPENISSGGDVTKGIIKTASVASLSPINTTKKTTNATTISLNVVSAFDSKESDKNDDSTMPEADGVLSIKLKSLLIPNQKRPRTAVVLSEDDSLSNKSVTVEASELRGEHSTIRDQNWKITKVQGDPQLFSMVSSVPLENPITFSENSINILTDMPTTENGTINDNADTIAFSPNIALQPIIPEKEQINKTSDYAVSHHVNKAVISPSAKEITISGSEVNELFSKAKAIVEDKSCISEAKIPVNLREVNSANINPFILKIDVTPAEQKVPGTFKETFYPDSTISTTKLTKAKARGSSSLDNDYTTKFRSKLPRATTHSLTNGNRKNFPKFLDDLSPASSTLSENGIIINLPEGKSVEHINAPGPKSVQTVGESRMFPDVVTDLTSSTNPIISKDQLYRRYGSFTTLYDQRVPTMSPTSEYNQDKTFKEESYHSQDATAHLVTFSVNLDNELPLVDEDSVNKENRASVSFLPMKSTHNMADTITLSREQL